VANASNVVALMPGNFVAGIADLERLPRWNRSFVGLITVCVAGSVVGAGLSVMLLAILSISTPDDFRTTNVIKNLISGLTSLVAVVVFVFEGMVAWPPTMAMMAGVLVGGFLGGRLAASCPRP
jgi:uncharacterized membrane protein YfcA